MERKVCDRAEIKLLDDGNGSLVGYGSTWDEDRGCDRIERGAFSEALAGFLSHGFIPLGHDWSGEPVAMPVRAYEDDRGLVVEAAFHSTPKGQAARTLVKERMEKGLSVGLSIGFRLDPRDTEEKAGVRIIKRVAELFEVSIVSVPMNPKALAVSAKEFQGVEVPRAGFSFADHSEAVLATVQEFVERAKGLAGLRAKEGRVLSEANRERMSRLHGTCGEASVAMKAVMDDLAELLAATEPGQKDAAPAVDPADVLRLEAELLRLDFQRTVH